MYWELLPPVDLCYQFLMQDRPGWGGDPQFPGLRIQELPLLFAPSISLPGPSSGGICSPPLTLLFIRLLPRIHLCKSFLLVRRFMQKKGGQEEG